MGIGDRGERFGYIEGPAAIASPHHSNRVRDRYRFCQPTHSRYSPHRRREFWPLLVKGKRRSGRIQVVCIWLKPR